MRDAREVADFAAKELTILEPLLLQSRLRKPAVLVLKHLRPPAAQTHGVASSRRCRPFSVSTHHRRRGSRDNPDAHHHGHLHAWQATRFTPSAVFQRRLIRAGSPLKGSPADKCVRAHWKYANILLPMTRRHSTRRPCLLHCDSNARARAVTLYSHGEVALIPPTASVHSFPRGE